MGGVNIAHYNAKHVFIYLQKELGYNTILTLQRMTIEGKLIRIQSSMPFFTPEEETPIGPVLILRPRLPFHFYKKPFLPPFFEFGGKVLYLDRTTIKRSRVKKGKVKMQIDLTCLGWTRS